MTKRITKEKRAAVTSEHRQMAYDCIWQDAPRGKETLWVLTGADPDNLLLKLQRTAQAIADAESRGAARATPLVPPHKKEGSK